MVEARDANLLAVTRAHREALISARPMEEANVVHGAIKDLNLEALLVIVLQEAKWACVLFTTRCWKMIASMGGDHWVLSASRVMPLIMEIALQTLKRAGTTFSGIQWKLLVVCRSQPLTVGFMVVTALCQCLLMA